MGSRCPLGWARGLAGTSRMTAQICLTHWMMVSGTPETVTARSVELGSKSPATCTCAPVLCRKQRDAGTPQPLPARAQHLTPPLSPLLSPQGPLQDLQCDAPSPASPPSAPVGLCQPPHPGLCAPRGKRGSPLQAPLRLTSRISRILAPALPMREPHWLAGMTRRRVTGALPADTPSPPAPRSCEGCGT